MCVSVCVYLGVFGGHEAFLNVSELQVIQRQHELLLFLLENTHTGLIFPQSEE